MVPGDNNRPAGIGVGITLRRMADNFFNGGSLVSALFHAIKCFFHRNRSTIHLQSGVAMILMQVSSSFPFFEARLGCCAGLAGPLLSGGRRIVVPSYKGAPWRRANGFTKSKESTREQGETDVKGPPIESFEG